MSLGKSFKGIASTFKVIRLGVTGDSLTRRPKRSLGCFLVKVLGQTNELVPNYRVPQNSLMFIFQMPQFVLRLSAATLPKPWMRKS